MKIAKNNQLKIVIFTAVKNRCILHGYVFVMIQSVQTTEDIIEIDIENKQHIMQTRPCNIQQYFTAVKMLIFG